MKRFNSLIVIVLLLGVIPCLNAQEKQINLADLDLLEVYQPFGNPMKNQAVTGTSLKVRGKTYDSGIGTQSDSRIKLVLSGKSLQFTCKIGVNDLSVDYTGKDISTIPLTDGQMVYYRTLSGSNKQFVGVGNGNNPPQKGSVLFKIIGDGEELYNSGIMRTGDEVRQVSLPVKGIDVLELNVENAGDGISGDHADWLEVLLTYSDTKPFIVSADYKGEVLPMDETIRSRLTEKIGNLPETSCTINQPAFDWLINNQSSKAILQQANGGKDLVLSNGLVGRVFRIFPNLATIDIQNLMTGENMLRAVSNEGLLTIDGKRYPLGGLDGQEEFGYTQYHWVDKMSALPNSFQITDFQLTELKPRLQWANKRWALVKEWKPSGKQLTFYLEGPGELKGIKIKLHYVLYDGLPVISKWMEVSNNTGLPVNLDEFVLEQLAMAEPESPVEADSAHLFRKPNIHVESDWGFHGFTEKTTDRTEYWNTDPRYTSQCNYSLQTPCLLEIKLPMGPDEQIEDGDTFESFRTWIMPFDSDDRERKGLFVRRMYCTIAPWTTENPIFMHCTSSDPQIVKQAVDQCVETGYEMVILSFGSGLNMEDESSVNISKFKELREYATAKGIELGGYSLLSSRWISDEVDVINPKTGKRGGMIFGSSPCLSSEWGHNYFHKIKNFYEKTGMTVFENDGSYPGNVCASTSHAHHRGLKDSQWKQREQIANLYRWMCEEGIYTNIPDYGYMLNGGSKVGIGYREVNWSLPRERQLVLGRQVMYDGLWERMPGMCWTFVPLTQYHGGGTAATLEPLSEHLEDYKAHMVQNYGTGVQACYRGHRLYDTEKTRQTVKDVIAWYKQYRDILNSEVIHLRRPDGKDWDGILHVNPYLPEKGFLMVYNPLNKPIKRTIKVPVYYTGLLDRVQVIDQYGKKKEYKIDRKYDIFLDIEIPVKGYSWYVFK